jgi:hypothetical protein
VTKPNRTKPNRTQPSSPPAARATSVPADVRWLSWIVGAVAAVIYAALSPNAPGDKDGGEFMLVLATYGVAHPTGYPLYTIVGGAFVHALHALGVSWAQASNWLSALCGGVAVGALHALATRLLRVPLGERRRGAAAGAAARGTDADAGAAALLPVAAFAFNPLWTVETTLAEVNAAHVAWVALAGLAALRVAEAIATSAPARRTTAALLWGCVVGVGLAHHLTSVLFAVPLTIALAWTFARTGAASVRTALAFVAGALVPLASVAWIAWHAFHPAAVQWPELAATWPAVIDHLTGAQYRYLLGRFAPSAIQAQELAVDGYGWIALAAAGAVAALFVRRAAPDRPVRVALAVAVPAQIAYAFAYGVSDPSAYFLPAMAVGFVLLVASLAEVPAVRSRGLWLGAAAAIALVFAEIHGLRVALNRRVTFERFDTLVRRMWGSLPPGPAIVVWDDDMAVRLVALQRLEGSRPDTEVIQPRHLSHPVPRARFVRVHGFDPVADLPARDTRAAQGDAKASAALVEAIVDRINRRTDVPVVLFLPEIPSLRQLEKPPR